MEPLHQKRLLLFQLIRTGKSPICVTGLRDADAIDKHEYVPIPPCPRWVFLSAAPFCTPLTSTPKGADDDGSGTVTILEAYRALLESGFKPNRTVEFHWYSAEVRPPFLFSV